MNLWQNYLEDTYVSLIRVSQTHWRVSVDAGLQNEAEKSILFSITSEDKNRMEEVVQISLKKNSCQSILG